MAKLTVLQVETLGLIEQGKVKWVRFGTAAWRIWGGSPGVVGKLASAGLAEYGRYEGDNRSISLTDAGRAALEPKP